MTEEHAFRDTGSWELPGVGEKRATPSFAMTASPWLVRVKSNAQTDSKWCTLFSKPCSLSLIRNPLPRERTDNSKDFLPHEFTFSLTTRKQKCRSLREVGRWKEINLLTTTSNTGRTAKISPKGKKEGKSNQDLVKVLESWLNLPLLWDHGDHPLLISMVLVCQFQVRYLIGILVISTFSLC